MLFAVTQWIASLVFRKLLHPELQKQVPGSLLRARSRVRKFAALNINLKEKTESALKTFTPREEQVLKMRFGLEEGSEHTLEEVGRRFSVTREQIRQIEAKAL